MVVCQLCSDPAVGGGPESESHARNLVPLPASSFCEPLGKTCYSADWSALKARPLLLALQPPLWGGDFRTPDPPGPLCPPPAALSALWLDPPGSPLPHVYP